MDSSVGPERGTVLVLPYDTHATPHHTTGQGEGEVDLQRTSKMMIRTLGRSWAAQ